MSQKIENTLSASGGHAAPAENLELPEEYSEEFVDFDEDDLAILAELQTLDTFETYEEYDALLAYGALIPEEQELADALLRVVGKYGKFNDDNIGVWAGYDSAEKNAENAAIGVKCGNCVFWQSPNGCQVIDAETEEGGLCRFAILPDGAVTVDVSEVELPIVSTAGSKPAPKKDRIKGSTRNKKGSGKTGKGVTFTKSIETSLSKKAKEHNEKANDGRKTSVRTLKAVYRRGAGAFSTSHRPDQNRNSWAMARVNAFLKLLKSGKPKNPKYTTDNDLLPPSHPKSSKGSASMSETLTAAADPCWDGYEQIGTKMKGGKEVPNCVPVNASNDRDWANYMLYDELEELADHFNGEVGPSRTTELSVIEQVADRAAKKYANLESSEIRNAIRWDLFGFLEYSTLGLTASAEFSNEYADLLPAGHPYNENPAVQDYASWISGAPGLDESSRDAIYASIAPSDDDVKTLHASTRVKTLIASGKLPEQTVVQIKEAILWSLAQ